MRRTILLLIALLSLPSSAFATWSVIAVDRATGRVVIASATTFAGPDFDGTWKTAWNLTVPVLSGTDWQVQNGAVAAVVSASVTDSDDTPHYAELAIEINVPRLASCTQPAADLRAWWPFNETSGTNSAELVAGIRE